MMPIIDQLESVRIALGIGLFFSNVAVWLGVYWERDDLPPETKERGWRLLIKGLAAEAALAFLLLAVDTTIGVMQRTELVSLEAQVAPRRLTPDQRHVIAATAAKFPGRAIRVASYALDPESAVLCEQILAALASHNPKPIDACMSESTLGSLALGIHVTGDDIALSTALLLTFRSLGLAATPVPPPPATGISFGGQNASAAARLFVGIKPIAP